MIGDKSRDQEATWEFLDRRIEDVVGAGSSINFVSFSVDSTLSIDQESAKRSQYRGQFYRNNSEAL